MKIKYRTECDLNTKRKEGRIIANSRDTNRSVTQRLDALAPFTYKPLCSSNRVLYTHLR